MRLLPLLLIAIALITGVWAQASSLTTPIRSALSYLQAHQSSGRDGYDEGQWTSQVTSTLPSPIGVGRYGVPYEEPTAFVAASIANVLAEIYFQDSRYLEIPAMLAKTQRGLRTYQMGPVFHFYPPKDYRGFAVRGPRYMELAPQWLGFTNTPPDSDTTSVSYLLRAYSDSIAKGRGPLDTFVRVPVQALGQWEQYRDVNRNPHVYNQQQQMAQTGAFLTWLYDEKNPRMPRNWFAPPDQGVRIPFNKNDVDCVVNANVLKTLTATGQTGVAGYRESCGLLNWISQNRKFYRCGMYYPSTYALPYTVASALDMGVACLKPSKDSLLDEVLIRQRRDGAWQNHWKARPDLIQSTAWALNTILLLGDPSDEYQQAAVKQGLRFLLSHAQRDSRGRLYWPGEVFYAAIFVARYPVVWRSTAYTTAVVTKALVLADQKWNIKGGFDGMDFN